jgi:hypothetical protein
MAVMQHRRGTAVVWDAADPVLHNGELGIETDTGHFKIGNGVTPWTGLPYGATPIVAVPAADWPPASPDPDTLYLKLAT